MTKVQIKHRYTDAVLFECEISDDMENRLRGGNLNGSSLFGAHLNGVGLRGDLKFSGDRPVMWIGPIGSIGRTINVYITDQGLRIEAGCFFGTRDEFIQKLAEEHGNNEHSQEYTAALVLIDAHARLWTPVTVKEKVAA